jgi:hypothetical protein
MRLKRAAAWLFRKLLCLYSRGFRERYGAELESLFDETVSAAVRRSRAGALRVASAGILDVLRTAPRERWRSRRARPGRQRLRLSVWPAGTPCH